MSGEDLIKGRIGFYLLISSLVVVVGGVSCSVERTPEESFSKCNFIFEDGIRKWKFAPSLSYFDHTGSSALGILTKNQREVLSFLRDKSGLNISTSANVNGIGNIIIVEHCSGLSRREVQDCKNFAGMNYCEDDFAGDSVDQETLGRVFPKCQRRGHAIKYDPQHYVVNILSDPILDGVYLSEHLSHDNVFPHASVKGAQPIRLGEVPSRRYGKLHYPVEGKLWLAEDKNSILNAYCLIKFDLLKSEKNRLFSECLIKSLGLYESKTELNSGEDIFRILNDPKWFSTKRNDSESRRISDCLGYIYSIEGGSENG